MGKNIQIAVQALAPIALSVAFSLGLPAVILGFIITVLSGCQSPTDTNSGSAAAESRIALMEENIVREDSTLMGEAMQ